ncbi:hypothetical protein HDV03_002453 [Kappamyces sp. JEL0829]|nr:hypothetical protein HDV03_002453 [Kappamyces sp. JEL0829]KAJ3358795.1 hypothetical protein HDU91_005116 [Kappamyces sp. JEL0680]
MDFQAIQTQVWQAYEPIHKQLSQKVIGPFTGYLILLLVAQIIFQAWPSSPKNKAAASHILHKDKKVIQDLKTQLEKNPSPELFAKLAEQHSSCPSAKSGGALGSFGKGQMVPEFEKVVFDPATEVNKVYGPVETQFGFHLIMVTKKAEK